MVDTKKMPEKKFRAGGVTATIWSNELTGKNGKPFKVNNTNIAKSYKDKDGQWKETDSFQLQDLPKVALIAQKAFEYLVMGKGKDEEEESNQPVTQT